MKRTLVLLTALFLLPLAAHAQLTTPAEKSASRSIRAADIQAHVGFLASDLLEGRGPGTRGDALAQQYIATQFQLLGLKPAGANGSYLQPLELVGMTGHPQSLTLTSSASRMELQYHDHFISTSGPQAAEGLL